jgi:CelD/BcsL family acetyltransferase involved in cellulose biosynthesis
MALPPTLASLADSWESLVPPSSPPTQHFDWIRTCAEQLANPSQLCVVILGTPDRPRAIAPLVINRGAFTRLEFLGVRELHEPTDLIYNNASDAKELATELAQLGLPLAFDRVIADSATVDAIRDAWRGRGVVVSRSSEGYPYLVLSDAWAEADPPLAAGRRSDLRRARRRAQQLGLLAVQIRSPTAADVDSLLDEFFHVEAASWKGRQGTALAVDTLRGGFFRRYAAHACRAGTLRLCILRIGGRAAAAQFAIESGNRFWLLKIGYDEEFAQCSPGLLLIAETVKDAASRGLYSYEFLGVAAPWTRPWTRQEHPCVSLRAYHAKPRGLMTLAADVVHAGGEKLRHVLRGVGFVGG